MKLKPGDEYQTPQWLFDELNKEFHFNIDICATKDNSKCPLFCYDLFFAQELGCFCIDDIRSAYADVSIDMIENKDCQKLTAFMNPPYSDPYPFIKRAMELQFKTLVMVLPAKTDTKWWRLFWDINTHLPIREYDGNEFGLQEITKKVEVRFMPYKKHHKSRVAFIDPKTGKPNPNNPCGTAVVIVRST